MANGVLGGRPAGVQIRADGNVITAWPTKLVLVPELAKLIAERLGPVRPGPALETAAPEDWPRPEVAQPPWETSNQWHR